MPINAVQGRTQKGETLISLMVGLVVAIVVGLAFVSIFKVSSRSSSLAGQDAAADAQATYALLRAAIAAQEAGYGVSGATIGTHITALSGVTLVASGSKFRFGENTALATAGSTGNTAVVWVLQTGANLQCAGLLFDSSIGGNGGLYYLGPDDCAGTTTRADLTGLAWTRTKWVDRPANQSIKAYDQTQITFSVATTGSCAPYGLTTTQGKVVLTISTTNRSGATLEEVACLLNFH